MLRPAHVVVLLFLGILGACSNDLLRYRTRMWHACQSDLSRARQREVVLQKEQRRLRGLLAHTRGELKTCGARLEQVQKLSKEQASALANMRKVEQMRLARQRAERAASAELAGRLREELAKLGAAGDMVLSQVGRGVVIRVPTRGWFNPPGDRLSRLGVDRLARLADVLGQIPDVSVLVRMSLGDRGKERPWNVAARQLAAIALLLENRGLKIVAASLGESAIRRQQAGVRVSSGRPGTWVELLVVPPQVVAPSSGRAPLQGTHGGRPQGSVGKAPGRHSGVR